jgi:hypothetical protein
VAHISIKEKPIKIMKNNLGLLPFIQLTLAQPGGPDLIDKPIAALKDSGCSNTCMSYKYFASLPTHLRESVQWKNSQVGTAAGAATLISRGTIDLQICFYTNKGDTSYAPSKRGNTFLRPILEKKYYWPIL